VLIYDQLHSLIFEQEYVCYMHMVGCLQQDESLTSSNEIDEWLETCTQLLLVGPSHYWECM